MATSQSTCHTTCGEGGTHIVWGSCIVMQIFILTSNKLDVIVIGLWPHTVTANIVIRLNEYLLIMNRIGSLMNSMVSHHLFPHILQPTRVTDHSATITDNIFTNVTEYDTISGNIVSQLADHFSQSLNNRENTCCQQRCNLLQIYCNLSKFDKINLYQTSLKSAGIRTKIFLLMLT